MCTASHGCGGLGGGGDGGGGWYAYRTKPGALVSCWVMPEHFLGAR